MSWRKIAWQMAFGRDALKKSDPANHGGALLLVQTSSSLSISVRRITTREELPVSARRVAKAEVLVPFSPP
jgi:hypothetical protein